MYRRHGKRWLDVLAAGLGLVALAPLLAVLALLVRIKLGSPVLFRQVRPGLHGQPFELIKFRSMTDSRDEAGRLLADAQRITKFGIFMRKASLDELPELWNVLRGDMSLVGPRPLLTSYLPYYTQREATRHNVRPGLTGLAQINGRNYALWDERLEMDAIYVEKIGLMLDLKILFKTVSLVLSSRNVVPIPGTVQKGFVAQRQEQQQNVLS